MKSESTEFEYFTKGLTSDLKTLFTGIEQDILKEISGKQTESDLINSIDKVIE